jgi:hypothetical protein
LHLRGAHGKQDGDGSENPRGCPTARVPKMIFVIGVDRRPPARRCRVEDSQDKLHR